MQPYGRAHRPFILSLFLFLTGVSLFLGLAACGSQPPSQTAPPAEPAAPAAAGPERHELQGKVVSVDKAAKSVTVNHGEIPGFMGAMTMPYPVKDESLLNNLSPGDSVNADVVVDDSGMWLENIKVAPK